MSRSIGDLPYRDFGLTAEPEFTPWSSVQDGAQTPKLTNRTWVGSVPHSVTVIRLVIADPQHLPLNEHGKLTQMVCAEGMLQLDFILSLDGPQANIA